MASSTLSACPDCQQLVSRLAEACPSCGRPLRPSASREGLFLRTLNIGVALVLGLIAFVVVVPLLVAVAAYVTSRLLR